MLHPDSSGFVCRGSGGGDAARPVRAQLRAPPGRCLRVALGRTSAARAADTDEPMTALCDLTTLVSHSLDDLCEVLFDWWIVCYGRMRN